MNRQAMDGFQSSIVRSLRLRHRISLAKPTQASDLSQPFGEPADPGELPIYATVWSEIKPLQGRDLNAAQQIVAGVSHSITIRYRGGVAGGDIVLFKKRKFRIEAPVNPEERNIRLDLLCLELNEGTVVAT